MHRTRRHAAERSGGPNAVGGDRRRRPVVEARRAGARRVDAATVADAFEDGRVRPPAQTEGAIGRIYAGRLRRALRLLLSSSELSRLENLTGRGDEALRAAREGRMIEAEALLAHARRAECAEPGRLRLVLRALLDPMEAYLHYRRADYARARALLRRASAIDDRLVREHGLDLLSAHRLQLGQNLVRIDARAGHKARAIRLGAALLNYIEFGERSLPRCLVSAPAALGGVPRTVVSLYFDKIGGEVALLLAARTDPSTRGLFQLVGRHALYRGCTRAGLGRSTHRWLYAKRLMLDGDAEAFLALSLAALREGRSGEPSLWFATTMDVAAVCRTLSPAHARVGLWMLREASWLEGAPPARRSLESVNPASYAVGNAAVRFTATVVR